MAARLIRPDGRSVVATFAEHDLGIDARVLYWQAASCAATCTTRVPARGKRALDLRPRSTSLAAQFAPAAQLDSRDVPASRLDVRSVSFGQRDLRMVLAIRTQGRWATRALAGGRSLCIVIAGPHGGNLCVVAGARRPVLRFQPAPRAGRAPPAHVIAATVSRPDDRTLRASFPATQLELPVGPFEWIARSSWHDTTRCRAGCVDRVPDSGAVAAARSVLAEPLCFAAAALDPFHPCHNATLDRVVYPSLGDAYLLPNAPCRPTATDPNAVLDPCAFGIGRDPIATVALIGDSHAIHWRAALEVVAQARRWRAFSITRAGCPFSTQIPRSPALGPGACANLHEQTITWLRDHPQVHTVFVSDWAEPPGGPQGGTGGYGGGPAQFGAMLDRLPASVQHIDVLRDIPRTSLAAVACVRRRLASHGVLRNRCATARSTALIADPGAAAAQARRPRARVIDLTRHFCTHGRCLTVIGGTFVYKDDNHMNAVFSQSLGPYLLRALS